MGDLEQGNRAVHFNVGRGRPPSFLDRGIEEGPAFAYLDRGNVVLIPAGDPFCFGRSHYYQSPCTSSLEDFVSDQFGATEIVETKLPAGHCVSGVWRPGRSPTDNISTNEKFAAVLKNDMQALVILLEKLSDLFSFVEPSPEGLLAHGHRIRELHILAATEVEHYWKGYVRGDAESRQKLSTRDYIELNDPLYLSDYILTFPQHPAVGVLRPFFDWDIDNPTKSLAWYHSYNLSKHDRGSSFSKSNLRSAVDTIAAVIVLFSVKYGHWHLDSGTDYLSARFQQLLRVGLAHCDPLSWYVPKLRLHNKNSPPGTFVVAEYHPWVQLDLN